jgi:hypothetical protein
MHHAPDVPKHDLIRSWANHSIGGREGEEARKTWKEDESTTTTTTATEEREEA